jgi:Rifampin ADP-ribosyl transferase
MVEPTGPIEDDPNLTDKKYPGNPTKSYRSRNPLRVIGEVTDWQGHSPEELSDLSDLVLRQGGAGKRRLRIQRQCLRAHQAREPRAEPRPADLYS